MNATDLLSDDEIEVLTIQILKFFHDDPLTPDELTDQVYQVAEWGTKTRLDEGVLELALRGEITLGFDRETGELKFRKLTPELQEAKARLLEEEEEEEEDVWWQV